MPHCHHAIENFVRTIGYEFICVIVGVDDKMNHNSFEKLENVCSPKFYILSFFINLHLKERSFFIEQTLKNHVDYIKDPKIVKPSCMNLPRNKFS